MIFILDMVGEFEGILGDIYDADYMIYWIPRKKEYYGHRHMHLDRYGNYEKEIRAKNCKYYEL